MLLHNSAQVTGHTAIFLSEDFLQIDSSLDTVLPGFGFEGEFWHHAFCDWRKLEEVSCYDELNASKWLIRFLSETTSDMLEFVEKVSIQHRHYKKISIGAGRF